MHCRISSRCGGCPHFDRSLSERLSLKKAPVLAFLQQHNLSYDPQITHFGSVGLRDRCDLQYHNGAYGLFAPKTREIVPMHGCPKVHPLLSDLIAWLQQHPMPIQKASLRLRRAPDETLGIWIDTANTSVAELLKEKTWLTKVSQKAIIEIGQKHKRLHIQEDLFRLQKQPVFFPWFETPKNTERNIPLHTTIGGFTQPSMKSNAQLVKRVLHLIQQSSERTWLEYGCGTGNFSIGIAQIVDKLLLMESDPIARAGLRCNFQKHPPKANVAVVRDIQPAQGILLDPPRNGIGETTRMHIQKSDCSHMIYVSCFFSSMQKDLTYFLEHGFSLTHIEGINQFPRSSHCEWIAQLKRTV